MNLTIDTTGWPDDLRLELELKTTECVNRCRLKVERRKADLVKQEWHRQVAERKADNIAGRADKVLQKKRDLLFHGIYTKNLDDGLTIQDASLKAWQVVDAQLPLQSALEKRIAQLVGLGLSNEKAKATAELEEKNGEL